MLLSCLLAERRTIVTPDPTALEAAFRIVRRSHMLRLAGIGVLALVLLIPILLIDGIVGERETRRQAAVDEVSCQWGGNQRIFGPVLIVPYTHRVSDGRGGLHDEARAAVVLPTELHADGHLETATRTRGVFSIPVYTAAVTLSGTFVTRDLPELGADAATAAWDRAELVLGLSDVRAIQISPTAAWNGAPIQFLPGSAALAPLTKGIHAPVSSGPGPSTFSVQTRFNGSVGLTLTPVGERTVATVQSNSGAPSFQGAWLPTERAIAGNGFRATWDIPFLGRNYPQVWAAPGGMDALVGASGFGLDLVRPVDQYRMADRSVKYAILFISLTFGTIWLIEVLATIRVHPIQYLFLGAALCTFYLLELSLAEHIGFALAYAIAASSVVALITSYAHAILHRFGWMALVGGSVTALYGYLYVLLMNEDYALLIGSIVLFFALAGVMFATRRVNWYTVGRGEEARA